MSKQRGWYLKFPVEFVDDPRVIELCAELGDAGFGRLIRFLTALSKLPDYRLHRSKQSVFAYGLRVDAAELGAFIGALLGFGLLLEDGGYLMSPDLFEWRSEYDAKARAAAEREQRAREARAQSDHTVTTEGGTPPYSSVSVSNSGSDSSPKEGGAEGGPPEVDTTPEAPPGKELHGKYLWLDPIELSQWRATHGDRVVKEAIQLANARVEAYADRPAHARKFEELKDEARNGGAVLSKWALREAFNNITRTDANKANLEAAKARQARASARPEPPRKPPPARGASAPSSVGGVLSTLNVPREPRGGAA